MKLNFNEGHFYLGRKDAGRNIHVPLVSEDGKEWFGKICCPINGVYDSTEREAITSRLARLVNFSVPQIEITEFPEDIGNFEELKSALLRFNHKDCGNLAKICWTDINGACSNWADEIEKLQKNSTLKRPPWNKIVIVGWINGAQTLRNRRNSLQGVNNLDMLIQRLVFNLWFGNHDGNMDLNIIVDEKGKGYFVDFGYAGTGMPQNLFKNVNGESFEEFGEIDDKKYYCKLLPQQLLNHLKSIGKNETQRVLYPMVESIQNLSDNQIQETLHVHPLYFPDTQQPMNIEFAQELCRRRKRVADKIKKYIMCKL